jgi:hypothetical protein
MLAVAQPLDSGRSETAFVLGHHWRQHFDQQHAADGLEHSVKALREYIDRPRRMGLDRKVQDLLILVYAAQAKRSFWLGDAPFTGLGSATSNECELRERSFPTTRHGRKRLSVPRPCSASHRVR